MNKKRLYFDMDGVLVNFETGIAKQSAETLKEYEGRYDEIPGIFGLMEPMPGAIEAVHKLNEHYDCYILSTAPWNNPSAWSDKVIWSSARKDRRYGTAGVAELHIDFSAVRQKIRQKIVIVDDLPAQRIYKQKYFNGFMFHFYLMAMLCSRVICGNHLPVGGFSAHPGAGRVFQ